ncbi:hypothetical protein WJX79_005520 [Trebouxia sp. C0005]
MSRVLPTRLSAPQLTTKCAALVICILSAARLRAVVLTGCFRVQHPVCMSRSCGSRRQLQNVRPLLQQDRLGDAAEIAFLRKRLEQLGEEKLILLRAQATGALACCEDCTHRLMGVCCLHLCILPACISHRECTEGDIYQASRTAPWRSEHSLLDLIELRLVYI